MILGCSNKNIRTANQFEDCAVESSRSPSSHCKLFYKKINLSLEIGQRIDDAFENLRQQYGLIPDVYENSNTGANAINHYKQISKNPELLGTYLNAGFTISKFNWFGDEELILKSPKHLKDIFKNLTGLILSIEPNLSKVVLPALVFQRRNEFKFSRPGFDPIPQKSEGWELVVKSIQLNNQIFIQAFAEGKLGITVDSGFLFHDISHLIDGAYQPNLMRLLRILFGKLSRGDKDLSWDISDPDIGAYINEFLITANPKNLSIIESLILDRASLPEAKKRLELQDEVRNGKFWIRLNRINEDIFKLLEFHGGATLDGYNLNANSAMKLRNAIFNYAIGESITKGDDFGSYLTYDSFWGLIQQMLLVKAVLTKNFAGFREFASPVRPSLKKVSDEIDESVRQKLELVLVDLFLELDARMSMAVKYQVSSERIIEDLISPNYKETRSYKFFKSVARKGSMEERLFVKP